MTKNVEFGIKKQLITKEEIQKAYVQVEPDLVDQQSFNEE